MNKYNKQNYTTTFIVEGNFYNIRQNNNQEVQCRDILFIKRKKKMDRYLDATFIMMNPGSSKPNLNNNIKSYNIQDIVEKGINTKLVDTIPDIAQFYVMKLMDDMNWDYIKVINLTDIREANSEEARKKVKSFIDNNPEYKYIHSIFDDNRIKHSNPIDKSRPVICACGVENPEYIEDPAIKYIKKHNISLIGKKKDTLNYYYINPVGDKDIVSDLVKEIKNS